MRGLRIFLKFLINLGGTAEALTFVPIFFVKRVGRRLGLLFI